MDETPWQLILKAADGEPVEAITFKHDSMDESVELTQEDAERLLSRIPLDGHWAVYAWTPSRVIFVTLCECWVQIQSVPRNPCLTAPEIIVAE